VLLAKLELQVYHGPFTVSTTLGNSNSVTVTAATTYPFDLTTSYTVTATSAFVFYIRVPSWNTGGYITLNGSSKALAPNMNGHQAVSIPSGTTTFSITVS
jgi:DUF1680 family protein